MSSLWRVLALVLLSGCAAVLPTPAARPSAATTPPARDAATGLHDARGAIHLHTTASDGRGTVTQIARLAQAADLDFVIITDHNTLAPKPEERLTGRPLVLVGEELSTTAGHLLALGIAEEISREQPVERIVEAIHAQGAIAIAAHPLWPRKPWTRWDLPLDGLEVFDFSTALSDEPTPWVLLKIVGLPNPCFWRATLRRPAATLALWDTHLATRPLVGLAGHDTHAHAGLGPFIVDSYQSGFHAVTTHVLADQLTPAAIYEGIREGRCYVGFEAVADPRPFRFTIEEMRPSRDGGRRAMMGGRVSWRPGLDAVVELPQRGDVVFFRNGRRIGERSGINTRWPIESPGCYRVEVSRRGRLWIVSNPIVLEPSAISHQPSANAPDDT